MLPGSALPAGAKVRRQASGCRGRERRAAAASRRPDPLRCRRPLPSLAAALGVGCALAGWAAASRRGAAAAAWCASPCPAAPLPPRLRRRLLGASWLLGLAGPPPPAARAEESLERRFSELRLDKLPSGFIAPWGPSDVWYPAWMEGRWHVRATLTNYSAPLGLRFVSNSGSDLKIARRTLREQTRRLGMPVEYDLRYVRTKRGNVAEDRLTNLPARINAYANRTVVRRAEYADVPGSSREEAEKRGDGPEDPLLTTSIFVKGGVQKIFVLGFQTEAKPSDSGSSTGGGDVFRASASTRTLFAAPGAGFNPIAVDEEVLTEYRRLPESGKVAGRVRLLGFLNPNDPLFFEAGSKAVTIADYELELSSADAL